MKNLFTSAILLTASSLGYAKEAPPVKRKPATAECAAANKDLAQFMINNAAKRIGHTAEAVKINWINATDERFVYSSSIYRAEYEVIVKTDSGCFPLEVELVDLARK